MKIKNYSKHFFYVGLIALTSCKPKLNIPSPNSGSIDASNYVAFGDAITSGYTNGALYYEGQQNSFSNLLAQQLKLVGGGDFKTPNVSQNSIGIGNLNNAPSVLNYRTDCKGVQSLGPVKTATIGDLAIFADNLYPLQGAFNNYGIFGLKVIDAEVNGYLNPFYKRMASSNTSSVLQDAVAKNPTFFTVMLGLNDVLNYALKGATADNITPLTGSVGVGFDASINNIITKLTANGAKGCIANIPSLKTLAYFNTIAYNALTLTDTTTISGLNSYYSNLDGTVFYAGNNGFIIEDSDNQFLGFRQAKQGEMILLNVPLDSVKCYKWGSLIPIPDRYSLTLSEINKIETAINQYNGALQYICLTKGLAYVDVNALFGKVKKGIAYNGVSINASFVSGGAFSLDGLTLTPRGNALLANEFIKSINTTYQSKIPEVNVTNYPGIKFP